MWHRHYLSTTKPGCIHRETPQRCTERPNSWLRGSSNCSFCNLTGWLSQNHAPGVKDTVARISKNLQAIHFFSCYTCINNIWDVWLGGRCFESSYDHVLEEWHQTIYLNKRLSTLVKWFIVFYYVQNTRKHEKDEFHAIWSKPVVYLICIQYCATLIYTVI